MRDHVRNPDDCQRRRASARTLVLALCFLLSGFAALVYQTAWLRQFGLVFGTSELAVATVLAAYMGGLAAGAWVVERLLPRVSRPVLAYATLELGIGASAIALVPALLFVSNLVLRAMFGGQPAPPDSSEAATSLFYLASAFVVLAVPTVLMGATLPLLARNVVHSDRQVGTRIGMLYAMNTFGAVAGALVTAFSLLPQLGMKKSIYVAAGVNLLVFALAASIARRGEAVFRRSANAMTRSALSTRSRQRARAGISLPGAWWVLPIMLLSGAVSFFHEVLWTRMLTHVLGSSIYAFGVMVATFLAGIALGGSVGAVIARKRSWALVAFPLCQLGCAIAAAAAFLMMNGAVPPPQQLLAAASFGAMILLPMTMFIGATFPLAVRILAEGADEAASASARVFAWNTIGAIVGSISAGFVLIPWLRFEGALHFAVAASCGLVIAATWMLSRASLAFAAVVSVIAIGLPVVFRPPVPSNLLRASPLNIDNEGKLVHYDVGRSASVIVLEQNGDLVLRTNGLPEAVMEMEGAPPRFSGEFWLSPLAVIARPGTQHMLIVGYGGGGVVDGVPPTVRNIDVIEIEPAVIEANRATRERRKRDPLKDPRLNLITNDARGALNLTSRRYDAIVSQPSHPWTAGASHLYTAEFMREARRHLTDDGVFVQWMNVTFLDEALLRSLTATLLDAFSEVRLYRPDPNTLVFLAAARPLELEANPAAVTRALRRAPAHYARFGINTAEDLLTALAVDAEGARGLADGAPVITDDVNRLAISTLHLRSQGLDAESMGYLLGRYDPLQERNGNLVPALREQVSFPYVARRLSILVPLDPSSMDRIEALSRELGNTPDGYAVRTTLLSLRGKHDAARQLAREAMLQFPDDQSLRYLYLRPWVGALSRKAAAPEIAAAASRLEGGAEAVLQAMTLAHAEDWQAVAALDPVLAQASWIEPWKIDAVQMRADWRSRPGAGTASRRRGEECLAIVDAAIVVQPTLTLYGLRARCALIAGRADALIESIWSLGSGTYNYHRNGASEERLSAKRDLETLIAALEQNLPREPHGAFDAARRDEVVSKLRDRIDRLDQL